MLKVNCGNVEINLIIYLCYTNILVKTKNRYVIIIIVKCKIVPKFSYCLTNPKEYQSNLTEIHLKQKKNPIIVLLWFQK